MRRFISTARELAIAGVLLWLTAKGLYMLVATPQGHRALLWIGAGMAAIVACGALAGLWMRLAALWRRGAIQRGSGIVARYGAVLGGLWLGSWLVAALIGAPAWAVFLAATVILSVRCSKN